jgi:hypothetical protein
VRVLGAPFSLLLPHRSLSNILSKILKSRDDIVGASLTAPHSLTLGPDTVKFRLSNSSAFRY